MILYLDTSALVKRYIVEEGTLDVNQWVSQARPPTTSLITRAEMGAAITRAWRLGWIDAAQRDLALGTFRSDWEILARLPVNEVTVRRADELACRHALRGFDAIHLACALLCQEGLGEPVTFATYDRMLWQASRSENLPVAPANLA